MSSFQDTQVCMFCGEEFWYEVDLKSGAVHPVSKCLCQRRIDHKDHIIELYAKFSAGLQVDVQEAVELIEAYLDGTLSSPDKTIEDFVRDLRNQMSGWQALDTWHPEPEDEED